VASNSILNASGPGALAEGKSSGRVGKSLTKKKLKEFDEANQREEPSTQN
jgi:hypothetical protein